MAGENVPPSAVEIVNGLRRRIAELERRLATGGTGAGLGGATSFTGLVFTNGGMTPYIGSFDVGVDDDVLYLPVFPVGD